MGQGVVVLRPVAEIRDLLSLTKFQLVVGIDRVCLDNLVCIQENANQNILNRLQRHL